MKTEDEKLQELSNKVGIFVTGLITGSILTAILYILNSIHRK